MIPSLNTKYLNDDQLKRLKDHKYSAEGTSVIEPIMQVFWRWIVEKIPLWWAPNAMTLVGLIINIATTGILFIYSPDAISEVRCTIVNIIVVTISNKFKFNLRNTF